MWGIFAGAVSAVSSFVSGAVGAISSAAGAIGSALSTTFGFLMDKGTEILSTVANVFTAVMQALGLFEPQDKPEDIGERALQAGEAGIKPENYDSFQEYMKELRAFEINPDKKHSTEQQHLAAIGVSMQGISETKDIPINDVGRLAMLTAISPSYFTAERISPMLDLGAGLLGKVLNYFSDQLDSGDMKKAEDALVKLEKERDPGLNEQAIYDTLDATRDAVNKESAA